MFEKKDWKETTVAIEGMHCQNCVKRMTKAFEGMKGVKEAKVDLEKKCATVTYDAASVSIEDLKKTVEDTGFTAA